MTINKFTGKTEEEAMEKVRKELGNAAVIMNVKVVKPKGFTGFFKSNTYEITAAVEDEGFSNDAKTFAIPTPEPKAGSFEAVADDAIILKDAFSAVNQVLEKQEKEPVVEPVIKKEPEAKKEPEIKKEPEPIVEEHIKEEPKKMKEDVKPSIDGDNHVFVKMLYNVLLENEVQEKYINQVLEDMDKVLKTSHSLDNLLSNVYQKMVLKLGTPTKIMPGEKKPKVVFFIGPTGVGKTTTIAKIASKFKVEEGKKVGLITADTYRMAAANQLQTYANILGVPLNVIYSADELLDTVKKQSREFSDLDVILVDTIGFSHKNDEQRSDTKKLVNALGSVYDSEVYLVLSATTKYKDLIEIADSYMEFAKFNLIFTKLDETKCLGNIFNLKCYTSAPLSYITVGQNVPDDIEILNAQKLVKQLLGGN